MEDSFVDSLCMVLLLFHPLHFFTSHLPPISSPTCIRVCSMSCWDCSRTISTRCSQVFDTASARSCPGGWVTYPPGGLQVESELEDIPARLYLYLDCYHTKMQVTNNHKNDNITFEEIIPINLHIQLVCGACPKHPEANIHSILWKWCNLQNSIQQKQRMVVRLFPLPEKYLGFQCCWRNSNRKRVWWWTICSSWRRTAESMSSHRLRLTFHATCLC